jgi:membrane protein YdbS with pleckstrin-like domain
MSREPTVMPREPSMKCQHCGTEVATNATFCQSCGKPLATVAAPAPPPTAGKQAFQNAMSPRGADDPDVSIWEGSYSKLAMIGWWLAAVGLTIGVVVLGLVAGFEPRSWGIAITVAVAIWIGLLLRLVYMQLSIHYTLTSQRFIHERGLLWRQQDRIETIDIDDVSVTQGPVERMLGVGSIRIASSDRSTPEFFLVGIEDVRKVAGMIDDTRRNERRKRGMYIESV